jgi:hypothetical protein
MGKGTSFGRMYTEMMHVASAPKGSMREKISCSRIYVS